MIQRVVSNTGPLIHLAQIDKLEILRLFHEILVSEEVYLEAIKEGKSGGEKIKNVNNVIVKKLNENGKDLAKRLQVRYRLDLGEATSLAIARQEGVRLFVTDDLEAREVGKFLGFEVHGTLGIILRAFRENMLSKENVIEVLRDLKSKSTIYITEDLIAYIIDEVNKFGCSQAAG